MLTKDFLTLALLDGDESTSEEEDEGVTSGDPANAPTAAEDEDNDNDEEN